MSQSRCRQNFSLASEAAINEQINLELSASYVYMAMGSYFAHDTVALPGLAKHFKSESMEEREHANKFIEYLTSRGGNLVLKSIEPPKMDWTSAKHAIETALHLERGINEALLKLHAIADDNNDSHLADFIEEEFLGDQVKSIKALSDMLTNLERCGCEGVGLYLFDRYFKS